MQRWRFRVLVLWWILLALPLAAEEKPPLIPGATMRAGQQYFLRYCSACHGQTGRGDGPAASAANVDGFLELGAIVEPVAVQFWHIPERPCHGFDQQHGRQEAVLERTRC